MPPKNGPINLVACVDKTSIETPVGIKYSGKESPNILLLKEKSTLHSEPLNEDIINNPTSCKLAFK
tara:strand:- start:49 stop:246 length:198 start_codon:yes stop_codon:yes gene_type:complete